MTGISRYARIYPRLALVSELPDAFAGYANPLALRSACATGSPHLCQKEGTQMGAFFLEQMTGIEPAFLAWEANALPLSYICIFHLADIL